MERFEPPYCMTGSAPDNFTMSIGGKAGATEIGCSFAGVTREHEIDAIIVALLAIRPLLRRNKLPPIPSNKSLTVSTAVRRA